MIRTIQVDFDLLTPLDLEAQNYGVNVELSTEYHDVTQKIFLVMISVIHVNSCKKIGFFSFHFFAKFQ